jgi:predicted CxxxxCH...CXXCH cytochrome family protein
MRRAELATFVSAAALLVTGCDVARPVADTGVSECEHCHGFPPASPHTQISDAQPSKCNSCHATAVAADGTIVSGGAHMDGTADFGHPSGFSTPSAHGYTAEAAISSCTQCHGADYGGGTAMSCTGCHTSAGFADWQTNCTFCHGTQTQNYSAANLPKAAPPEGVHGETLTTDAEVGAHQKHVVGGALSDGVACGECHVVPSGLSHLDGTAAVAFGALATQGTSGAAYAGGTCTSTYCHGATLTAAANTTPSWTGAIACGDCHGSPPSTGRHGFHDTLTTDGMPCYFCHADVAANAAVPGIADTPAAKDLHVNGQKSALIYTGLGGPWDSAARTCSNVICHGAPPTSRPW